MQMNAQTLNTLLGLPMLSPQLPQMNNQIYSGNYRPTMQIMNGYNNLGQNDKIPEGDKKTPVHLIVNIPLAKKENVEKFNVNPKPAPPKKLNAVRTITSRTGTDFTD